jgi:Zn-finger nucleic acid-binding protein
LKSTIAQCRGVWLDRGELDKIIERSMHQMPQSRGDEAYQDRSRRLDKGDNPHKKKKSFLGELLDF